MMHAHVTISQVYKVFIKVCLRGTGKLATHWHLLIWFQCEGKFRPRRGGVNCKGRDWRVEKMANVGICF